MPTTAAPRNIAGWRPATKSVGDTYEPLAVNTAARTATPNTPPSSRIALFAPDALPSSSGRTDERTTLAIGAKNSPIPVPARMKAGTIARYSTVGVTTSASHASEMACRAMPTMSSGRVPVRVDAMPASGATTTGMNVHGSVRSPASSGL
jgi:hypothetical protein